MEEGELHKERVPLKVRERIERELGADMFSYLGGA